MDSRKNLLYVLFLTLGFLLLLTLGGGCGGGGSGRSESFSPGDPAHVVLKLRAGVPLRSAEVTFYDVETNTKIASVVANANKDGLAVVTAPITVGRDLRCTADFKTKQAEGSLSAYVPSYKNGTVIYLNIITTITDRYIAKTGATAETAYKAVYKALGIPDELDVTRTSDDDADIFLDSSSFLREARAKGSFESFVDTVASAASENKTDFIKAFALENAVGLRLFAKASSLGTNAFNVTHAPSIAEISVAIIQEYINEASQEAAAAFSAMANYPAISALFYRDKAEAIQAMDNEFAKTIEKVNANALHLMEEYERQAVAMQALYEEVETITDLLEFKEKANALRPAENKFLNKHNELLSITNSNIGQLQKILERGAGEQYSVISADMAKLAEEFDAKTGNYIWNVLSGDNFGEMLENYSDGAIELITLLSEALETAHRNGYISYSTYFNVLTTQYAEIFKNTYCGLTVYMNCLYADAIKEWAEAAGVGSLDITEQKAKFTVAAENAAKANKEYLHTMYELLSLPEDDGIFFTDAVCRILEHGIGNVEINEWIASSDKTPHGGIALWSYEDLGFPYWNGFKHTTPPDGVVQTKNTSGDIAPPTQYLQRLEPDKSFFGDVFSEDQESAEKRKGLAYTYTCYGPKVALNRYIVSPDTVVPYDSKKAWSRDRWMLGEWKLGGVLDKIVKVILQNISTGEVVWETGRDAPPEGSEGVLYKPHGFASCFKNRDGGSILQPAKSITQKVSGADTRAARTAIRAVDASVTASVLLKPGVEYGEIMVEREWLLMSEVSHDEACIVTARPDIWTSAESGASSAADEVTHEYSLEVNGTRKAVSNVSWTPESNDVPYNAPQLSVSVSGDIKSVVLRETIKISPKSAKSDQQRVFHSTTILR